MLTKKYYLITKPIHQTQKLSLAIEALGGQCILIPSIEINFLSQAHIRQCMTKLPRFIDQIIFTSANAVYPAMVFWDKLGVFIDSVFAIGSGTANALAKFGISAITPEKKQFNTEGLLALSALKNVRQHQIVIFTGKNGRSELLDALTKREAIVTTLAVYERKTPILKASFPPMKPIELVIVTSAESLNNLWQMVGEAGQRWLVEQRLLVVTSAMQILAQTLGFKQVPVLAENASDEAILVAMQQNASTKSDLYTART